MEDYETQAGNVKYAHNLDIFKRINALLDNTLDLSSLTGMPIPQDQQKRKILFVTSLNALLDNMLDLSSLTEMSIPQDQQKRKILFVTSFRLSIAKQDEL